MSKKSRIRPANAATLGNVRQAIECLKSARELMKNAGCPNTVRKIRLALTSANGAERHTLRRWRETEAQQ